MKNLAVWTIDLYRNDGLFDLSSPLNRDDSLSPMHLLQKRILSAGGLCHTHDVYLRENRVPDIVLFHDIPRQPVDRLLGPWSGVVRKWVVLQECEAIIRRNWDRRLHRQFERIFTWNDELAGHDNYVKLNFSNRFPDGTESLKRGGRERFCTLIAGNKMSSHPLELYSRRVEAIRWFERNHPDEFDLYGIGWDQPYLHGGILGRVFGKNRWVRRRFAAPFPSYRGAVDRKKPVLEKYKFAICYENARDISGYITEKIFDCMFAGCVPVYWGAGNVTDHVLEGAFIDRRDFDSMESLYGYLKTMDDATYGAYQDRMESYIRSPMSREFTDECHADTIFREMSKIREGR